MNILFKLLLIVGAVQSYPIRNLTVAEYAKLTEVVYITFKLTGNIKFWIQCVEKKHRYIDQANENLRNAISLIQNINIKKVFDLLKGIQRYINYVVNTIFDCEPCGDREKDTELKKLYKMLYNPDYSKVLEHLTNRFNLICDNFLYAKQAWDKQDLTEYGKAIANLIQAVLAY